MLSSRQFKLVNEFASEELRGVCEEERKKYARLLKQERKLMLAVDEAQEEGNLDRARDFQSKIESLLFEIGSAERMFQTSFNAALASAEANKAAAEASKGSS
jgi:hypothetical protein